MQGVARQPPLDGADLLVRAAAQAANGDGARVTFPTPCSL